MKPTWWQLYGIGALLVALIGLIETVLSAGALYTTLESAAVIFAFVLMVIWRITTGWLSTWRGADESHDAHVPRSRFHIWPRAGASYPRWAPGRGGGFANRQA